MEEREFRLSGSPVNRKRHSADDRKRSRTARLMIAALLLVLGGWVTSAALQDPRPTPGNASTGAQVGKLAPDFSVSTLDGGTFTLSAQRGRLTIIYFTAYWCVSCIAEARALAQIHEEFGDWVSIIALDVDPTSSPKALEQYKANAGNPDYIWAIDVSQEVVRTYQISSLGTTLILDANGVVTYRDASPTPYETLKEALTEVGTFQALARDLKCGKQHLPSPPVRSQAQRS